MGNILEEFWYGNINPQEQSKENSQAIKEMLKLIGRNREWLTIAVLPLIPISCRGKRKVYGSYKYSQCN